MSEPMTQLLKRNSTGRTLERNWTAPDIPEEMTEESGFCDQRKRRTETRSTAARIRQPSSQGMQLGVQVLAVGRSRDSLREVSGMPDDAIASLLRGPAGQSVWLRYLPMPSLEAVTIEVVRLKREPADKAMTLTWPHSGFVTEIPIRVIEQFPGSKVRYEFIGNKTKLLTLPNSDSGKRIAVLTNLLMPEVDNGRFVLRLTDDFNNSPVAYVERSRTPELFDFVARNDPLTNGWVIMHVRLRADPDSSRVSGDLEEIMFLDKNAPDVYKPSHPLYYYSPDTALSAHKVR